MKKIKNLDEKIIKESVDALISIHSKMGSSGIMQPPNFIFGKNTLKINKDDYNFIRKIFSEYCSSYFPKINFNHKCMPGDLEGCREEVYNYILERVSNFHLKY